MFIEMGIKCDILVLIINKINRWILNYYWFTATFRYFIIISQIKTT